MSAGRKHKGEEAHENEERWLLTYADLITLLMVFFVVLYAMSRVDSTKFQSLIFAMREAFNNMPTTPVPTQDRGGLEAGQARTFPNRPGNPPLSANPVQDRLKQNEAEKRAEERTKLKERIEQLVAERNLSKVVNVSERPGNGNLVVRLSDSLLFEPGSSIVSESSRPLLDSLTDVLRDTGKFVRIEGHTDNIPISTARYQSNWQLSTDRSTSVLMYMQRRGIGPSMLSASGYGEYRPIAPNDTPESRAQNRRVEFVILETPD